MTKIPTRGAFLGKERRPKLRGIWCPRHPQSQLVRMELPNGKIDLRCPQCTEDRRLKFKIVMVK